MKGQCPVCHGLFEAQPNWIGKQAACPHCKQMIVIQNAQKTNILPFLPDGYSKKALIVLGAIDFLLSACMMRYSLYFAIPRFIFSIIGVALTVDYFCQPPRSIHKIQWEYFGIVMSVTYVATSALFFFFALK